MDQSFIKENEEDVVANVSLVDSIKKQDETSDTSICPLVLGSVLYFVPYIVLFSQMYT